MNGVESLGIQTGRKDNNIPFSWERYLHSGVRQGQTFHHNYAVHVPGIVVREGFN